MNITIKKQKNIALVAHDNRKDELLDWLKDHIDQFKGHHLVGTGTTAALIKEKFDVEITPFLSGPLGGDQQLGASIAENKIDLLFFFWDPLAAQPHDPDVKALLRIAVLYDVPVAQSVSGANYLISSSLFNEAYEKEVVESKMTVKERVKKFD